MITEIAQSLWGTQVQRDTVLVKLQNTIQPLTDDKRIERIEHQLELQTNRIETIMANQEVMMAKLETLAGDKSVNHVSLGN